MKMFSIILWIFGALFSLWGFLILWSASASENVPIGTYSYILPLTALGFFYMAWKEFKSTKIKNKKGDKTPYKIGRLEWIVLILSGGYMVYYQFFLNH